MNERDTSRILPTILVVEDDDAFRAILVQALEARGYDVLGVADAKSSSPPPERTARRWRWSICGFRTNPD